MLEPEARLLSTSASCRIRWDCIRLFTAITWHLALLCAAAVGWEGARSGQRRKDRACQPQTATALASAGGPTHLYAQLQLSQLPAPLDQGHLHHLRSTRCFHHWVHTYMCPLNGTQPSHGRELTWRVPLSSTSERFKSPAPTRSSAPSLSLPCTWTGGDRAAACQLEVHAGMNVRKRAISNMTAPCRTTLKPVLMLCSTHFNMKVAWRGALVFKLQQGSQMGAVAGQRTQTSRLQLNQPD